MYYLVDTNVFLHSIYDKIFAVADVCKKSKAEITVTETILNELEPGYYLELENPETRNVYNSVYSLIHGIVGFKVIRIVKLDDIPGAKEELKRIRKKYYSWINDANYLRYLINQGKITAGDVKKNSFRKKDLGECELIAIARTAEDEHQIVTNDNGKVFLHPDINLFDEYEEDPGVIILSSEEWLDKIGYKAE